MQREATHKEFLLVRQEGNRSVKRPVDFYKLDAIISVGYRVKSALATRFRIWAIQRLREYIVKGFVLDDERLKNPDQPFDYFEELERRIQDTQRRRTPRCGQRFRTSDEAVAEAERPKTLNEAVADPGEDIGKTFTGFQEELYQRVA